MQPSITKLYEENTPDTTSTPFKMITVKTKIPVRKLNLANTKYSSMP